VIQRVHSEGCAQGFVPVPEVVASEATAHSVCMLRMRSPFFKPPCSILAPRLVPVTPSLHGEEIKTHKSKKRF
jgi:hypothetical protein